MHNAYTQNRFSVCLFVCGADTAMGVPTNRGRKAEMRKAKRNSPFFMGPRVAYLDTYIMDGGEDLGNYEGYNDDGSVRCLPRYTLSPVQALLIRTMQIHPSPTVGINVGASSSVADRRPPSTQNLLFGS